MQRTKKAKASITNFTNFDDCTDRLLHNRTALHNLTEARDMGWTTRLVQHRPAKALEVPMLNAKRHCVNIDLLSRDAAYYLTTASIVCVEATALIA